MELLVVMVLAAGIGFLARYVMPHRETYGIVLLPAVAAIASAAVWVPMRLAGTTPEHGWIWLLSLLAAAAVSVVVPLVLGRIRPRADAALLAELMGKKA